MLKLPLSAKPTTSGAVGLYDAHGMKIATVRTGELYCSTRINRENGDALVAAVNDRESLITLLREMATVIRSQNGNQHADINAMLDRAAAIV